MGVQFSTFLSFPHLPSLPSSGGSRILRRGGRITGGWSYQKLKSFAHVIANVACNFSRSPDKGGGRQVCPPPESTTASPFSWLVIQVRGSRSAVSFPSGSVLSPPAKCILKHFEMKVTHFTACACEIWSLKHSSAHSVRVALNNSSGQMFNCCWRENPKSLLFYCGTLPPLYTVDQRRILAFSFTRS